MPTVINDGNKAAALVQEKQQLEVNLAWELLELFNKTKDLIEPLRECAELALTEMIAIRDGVGAAAVQAAIDAEKKNMSLLKKVRTVSKLKDKKKVDKDVTIEKASRLELILKEVPTLDAQEISDVVRLYGTFVEKAAEDKELKAFYESVNKKRDGFRGGSKIDAKMIWNQGKAKESAGRHRAAILNDQWKDIIKGLREAKVPENQILDLTVQFLAEAGADYEKSSRGAVQNFLVSMEGGGSVFALKDTSTVGKLDEAFGLVPAADISGTTADTMFFFNKFPGIDPIFQILPLATIVAGAHHSLIEVALPLSINKVIDYDIGFYASLYPAKTKHAAAGAVKKILDTAQSEKLNHYVLAWYGKDGKNIEGCYQFLPSEKKSFEAFRKFARATNALAVFSKVKAVDKATIDDLVKKNGLDAK